MTKATLNKVNRAVSANHVGWPDSLFLFLLEDPDAVAADRYRDADHGLEQLDGDLFLGLVDLHDAGLFSLERAGDQFDNVAFHDPADDRFRGEVRLDFREGDSRRLPLALRDRIHDDVQPVPVPSALRTCDGQGDLTLAVRDQSELLLRDLRERDVPDLVLDAVQFDGPLGRIGKLGIVDEVHLDPDRVVLGSRVRDDDSVFFRLPGREGDFLFLQVQFDGVVADCGRFWLGLRLRLALPEIVEQSHSITAPRNRKSRAKRRVRIA